MTTDGVLKRLAAARATLTGNMATEGSEYGAIQDVIGLLEDVLPPLFEKVDERRDFSRQRTIEVPEHRECMVCSPSQPCERARRLLSGEGS